MKTSINLILFAASLVCTQTLAAQNTLTFSFDEFSRLVKANHPMARQANLQKMRGESFLRKARGKFDPALIASVDNKDFSGDEYFSITNATLKIPTALAAELKAGYDLNNGTYLNPADATPDDGLLSAGVSLPLLQGLVIDERRAALQKAKAFVEFANYERDVMINDLLLNAYNSYWNWWAAYSKTSIATEILDVATERFSAVKARALAGQAPMIDTVEAHIQVLMRRQNLQEARTAELKTRFALSGFLWDEHEEELTPRILNQNVKPLGDTQNSAAMNFLMLNYLSIEDSIATANPYLKQFDAKLLSVEVDEKMKRERLKPKINLNYNLLTETVGATPEGTFSPNNYKWGVEFGFPILLRAERGDLQLTRIVLQETKLEQQQKTQEVRNKARATYESIFLLQSQIEMAENNLANYLLLLEGERTRFFNGESSLFLVNQRELQYADAQTKLVELKQKLKQTENELAFLTGTIDE